MKQRLTRIAGIALLALFAPATVWAAGFGVSEFGSEASGRAYSGTAAKDSPAMVYWNPAQLTQMEGLQLSLGAAFINLGFTYESLADEPVTADSEKTLTTPPSFWMSYKLGGKKYHNWSIGAGVGVPFGSSVEWPADWIGNQEIQKLGLRVFDVRFVTAFSLGDFASIGGGVRVLPATVELAQAVGLGSAVPQGGVELAGDDIGLGWVLGASFYPHERFTLSLTFRSGAELEFEGAADFQNFSPPFDTLATDSDVSARLELPWEANLGWAWEILEDRFIWTADVGLENWSSFDELRINFLNDDGSIARASASPRDSRNIIKFKTGLEYRIADMAAVRAGYLYDPYITPENNVGAAPPDSDTHVVSLGASYYWNWLGVHAHFLYALFSPRTSTTSDFPGKWEGSYPGAKAFIYGLSLSAKFDVGPAIGCDCTKSECPKNK